mmetsp:Transcript_30936/g.45461  ORF Transcript_30936/g.45461 Transcript_30936/m.45461 type:complete len:163 (-) Transcript_30936:1644-2132(-)
MFIRPGNFRCSHLICPRLSWVTTVMYGHQQPENGGKPKFDTNTAWTSVDLLSMHAIIGSSSDNETDSQVDDEDVVVESFFSITTNDGDVHVFEARSPRERNRIVHGLKNVVAKLSYHLVLGDIAVSTTLYGDDYGDMGEDGRLPSLCTPEQAMNELTHAYLD